MLYQRISIDMKPSEMLKEIKELDEVEDGIAWWRVQWLIKRVETLTEVMNEFRLGHVHNETCEDYRPLGDTYGWCSICSTKVRLNEDLARDVLDNEDFKF
jgi:hypothetical protein